MGLNGERCKRKLRFKLNPEFPLDAFVRTNLSFFVKDLHRIGLYLFSEQRYLSAGGRSAADSRLLSLPVVAPRSVGRGTPKGIGQRRGCRDRNFVAPASRYGVAPSAFSGRHCSSLRGRATRCVGCSRFASRLVSPASQILMENLG